MFFDVFSMRYTLLFDNRIEFCNEFVNVDAVYGCRFFKRFAVCEHAMQAMHSALLQHFCEFVGVALREYVDDEHIFCYHCFYLRL